jgi:hypothetical protein
MQLLIDLPKELECLQQKQWQLLDFDKYEKIIKFKKLLACCAT